MTVIWLVIVGAAAGFLATRAMGMRLGVIETIGVGMAGAAIGTVLLRLVLTVTGFLGGLLGAVLGAMLLIWLWQTFLRR